MTRARIQLLALLALGMLGCGSEVTGPVESSVYGLLSLVAPDTATADAASLVIITAEVDSLVPKDKRKVTFTSTTAGFGGQSSITVLADSSRKARASLTSPSDSTVVRIVATTELSTRTRDIVFHRALAERIELSSDAFQVDTGFATSINLTALLKRTFGSVSPGARVRWSASTSASKSIGQFSKPESTIDATGQATVKFALGYTSDPGPITITAAADSANKKEITATTIIRIKIPLPPKSSSKVP